MVKSLIGGSEEFLNRVFHWWRDNFILVYKEEELSDWSISSTTKVVGLSDWIICLFIVKYSLLFCIGVFEEFLGLGKGKGVVLGLATMRYVVV